MSELDPQAPSQPNQQTAFNQAHNPSQKTPYEASTSRDTSTLGSNLIDHREQHDVPAHHGEDATASSLGRGDTGALKEKDISESDSHPYSSKPNLEGEQMRAPGEGDVAAAVAGGGGGGHAGQDSLTQNMDAKFERHKQELHARGERTGAEIEEESREDWTGKKADISEALAGRGNKVVLAPEEYPPDPHGIEALVTENLKAFGYWKANYQT